jgi:hypothetical protein
MVIGEVKVTKATKVYNNPYYGDYEVVDTFSHHIVNEKYVGLVSPDKGIHIIVKSIDGDKLDIIITKYAFTGEDERHFDKYTDFSTSFGFGGHIYEVSVDKAGDLVSLDEWYGLGDFEDGNEPDNHYTRKSRGIKWEKLDE